MEMWQPTGSIPCAAVVSNDVALGYMLTHGDGPEVVHVGVIELVTVVGLEPYRLPTNAAVGD